ncbi:hypothetical protein [Streptomyces sp. NPDC013187]|uniref:hypothetical protein n=1 Tax=Streptomyces sp. NPDC013187 TaxID=3364865 RepID=UPI0036BFECD0
MRSLTHTTAATTGALAAVVPLLIAPPAAAATPGSAGASADVGVGFGWWPYALGAALLISLAIPVPPRGRRRGGQRGGRGPGE